MKSKVALASVLSIALATMAFAQQNTFPSSGNVGIGTTSPTAALQIDGVYPHAGLMVSASAVTTQPGIVVVEDSTGDWLNQDNVGDFDILSNQQINLSANANGNATPQMSITNSGNVGIGTTTPAYPLDVVGIARAQAGVIYPDGNKQTTAWTGVLCGGDYAESVDVRGTKSRYEPGDVIVVDPGAPGKFLKSSDPYSTLVAGIYSTKPGVVGKRTPDPEKSKQEIPMAMVGIVPTKVSAENGAIKPGDLLVTSSRPGYAMKGTDRERIAGAILGKALGSLKSGTGTIEVLVTLQ